MNEELKIIITAEIEDLKKKVDAAQKEIKDLGENGSKNMGKFAGATKGFMSKVGSAIQSLASLKIIGEKVSEIATATKEYQVAQAKLKTAFETAGSSADVAKQTYNDLYRVLGDDQQAVEAANHLAQMTTNQKELEQWTKITQGVYATFGDSLPIESLTEAANETAKTGELTGALADALNWAGVAEEDFQAQLLACNDEAEREALIRTTLSGLYNEAAEGYEKNAAAILAENEAQAKLTDALATMGAVALPIMTMLKTIAADLLTQLAPFVELIANGLKGAFEGSADAGAMLAEGLGGILNAIVDLVNKMLPMVIQLIVDLIPVIISTLVAQLPSLLQAVIFGIVQILDAIASMLPSLIPIIIDAILVCVETILDNLDLLVDSGISLIMALADGLLNAIPIIIEKLPIIIEKLVDGLVRNAPKLIRASIELVKKLAAGIIQNLPELARKIPQIISTIVNGLKQDLSNIKDIGKDLIKGLWNGIKDMTGWIKDKIKGFGKSVVDGLKNFFGIKSPSKLMENVVGKNLALGIGEGFMDNMKGVNKDIAKSIAPLTNMSISGSITGPSALSTGGSGLKPISTGNSSIDSLAKAINSGGKTVVLQVDKRILGQITVDGINDITKLTGSIPLQFA